MPADHETTVRAFFGAWVERDPDRLTSFFAPDGTWSEANRDAAKGHDQIRPVFELQAGFASDFGVGEGVGVACALIQQNKPAQERMAGPCRRKFFMNTAHPNEEVASIKRQRRRLALRVANFRAVNDDGRWPGNIIL